MWEFLSLSSLVVVRRFSLGHVSVAIANNDLLLGSSEFSLWALKNQWSF